MSNGAKQRFIELLEQEATQAHETAQAWRELIEEGAIRLEDAKGNTIATASEMVTKSTEKENRTDNMEVKAIDNNHEFAIPL